MCIFCKIANKEIPAKLIYEDDSVVAFPDINPQAPVHILIVPKKHLGSLKEEQAVNLAGPVTAAIRAVAKQENLNSYRVVVNTGAQAGQTVDHLHYHLLGGRDFSWPPG